MPVRMQSLLTAELPDDYDDDDNNDALRHRNRKETLDTVKH
jgi:hypothetical protein